MSAWESQKTLDAFAQTRLAPSFQKHGIPMPEVQIYPLHNATAYTTGERYRV